MDNIILKHKQLYSASTSDEKVLKVGSRNVVGLCVHVLKNTTFAMKIQLLGLRNTVFRSQRLAGLHYNHGGDFEDESETKSKR